ncbi:MULTISPECIES: phage holin family protein [Giesbergeria]|uniref:Phage holin family protein n=1 Tax=Giesbergeria sinuosa TaxID=80883 RepID=A0ABV9QFI0_9BURK
MNWIALLGLDAWVARWRVLLAEGAIAAEDRLSLARLEWLEQRQRLRQVLVLAIVVTAITVVALLVLSLAVLVHFWDTPQRGLVAWVLAGLWCLAWIGTVVALVSSVRRAGHAFALTRQELHKDWQVVKDQL